MVSTPSRSGSSYSYSAERSFDAWGQIRIGVSTGDPKGRYCANLGHKQDDESGLIYMRARYYEPGSGRFINEDVTMSGRNWFTYCSNSPVARHDTTGKWDEKDCWNLAVQLYLFFVSWFGGGPPSDPPDNAYENKPGAAIEQALANKELEERKKRLGLDYKIESEDDVLVSEYLLWSALTAEYCQSMGASGAGLAIEGSSLDAETSYGSGMALGGL